MRTPLSRLPIRLRLAVSVGAVTFVVLVVLGAAVRTLTAHRLRGDLDTQVTTQEFHLAGDLHPDFISGQLNAPDLTAFASIDGGVIRIYTLDGNLLDESANAPYLGSPLVPVAQINGYRVATKSFYIGGGDFVIIQFALPLASLDYEIHELDLLLLLGVLAGTAIAFGAGWLVARRAILPIAELTEAAAEIERTGDPTLTLPEPTADDEVAELSRTLATMLSSLGDARARTEAALERQRAFVADASHELRTPLTSVLANLELLTESLRGPERDAARSALRSTQRMRRLVADLLLLARSDVRQPTPAAPLDLAELVIAAAGELEPSAEDHELELDTRPAPLVGSADELQRVAINLIENAIRHTPAGTHIKVTTRRLRDGQAELVVADDGPGIAPEQRKHLFERFARGGGESGGSFGLGLAIVQAVTRAHNGTIEVRSTPGKGARFIVRLAGRAAG
ncbi:MAG: HAMP domain-containing sensor histidine kinase [Solirubrobacteraceae bacterium]|jgi:signal transduction histidine kinase